MAPKICIVLILAFFGVLAEAAPRPALAFLGSVRNSGTEKGAPMETLYYNSLDTVRWGGVQEICRAHLGTAATPVYMDTIQELIDVVAFLDSVKGYSPYLAWIGGDASENTGKLALIASDNWDATSDTQLAKIKLYRKPVYDESHYFLCKLQI